jgi:predicted HTH transcriptional regulator
MPEEKPTKSLFKSLFGFGSLKAEPPNNQPPIVSIPNSPSEKVSQPKTVKGDSLPQTEAYQNRKKGRKLHRDSWQDLDILQAAIQSRGEAVPGDLAAELTVSRSTLAYNLNRLVKKGRIERLGGGRSIRYRVIPK